jgi:glycosyltransferase involved in cell wall biosynthesis
VPASYFLYIGNFYPHKNIENLIKAFAEVSGETNLVLVGPEDFFTEHIRTKIKEYGQTSRIKIITGVNDGQKLYLYQHADALVHPALSEGFGLPLIEAAYCGKPILASRIPVFEELWQDSYISFDPLNTKDISKKLMSFIEKKPQFDYSTLLKKYSFVEMSRQIVDLYHKL